MDFNIFRGLLGRTEEPLTNATLKRILSDTLTPLLAKMGLRKNNGEYLWYSDFNQEGIRRVFKYTLMKGNCGLIAWGGCFKNIPTVTLSKNLQYHVTDKSVVLQLWEWPKGYSVSLEKEIPPTDLVSHASEKECRRTLQEIFSKYRMEMEQWYNKSDTLAGCLEITNDQIEQRGAYQLRWPSGNYMKIFLTALLGDKEGAIRLLASAAEPTIKGNANWKVLVSKIEKAINSF